MKDFLLHVRFVAPRRGARARAAPSPSPSHQSQGQHSLSHSRLFSDVKSNLNDKRNGARATRATPPVDDARTLFCPIIRSGGWRRTIIRCRTFFQHRVVAAGVLRLKLG